MESKHAAIAPSPRRDTAGLPPPRTNSFMVRALAGPERKFEDHDPAIGTAAVRKVSRARLPGDVTPVRSVGPDSDSENEDASHKRALLNAFEDRPPKLDPHQFDHVDTNPEYNNVSVEDIEHRLRTSFVYNMEERGCTEMRLTIDPRGEFMKKWDVLMIVLILYVCMVTPFEIGFLGPASGLLLVLNRLVDALFAVDMVVNFFLGYFDEHGQWEFDNKKIAKHYLRGWFAIDLVSVVPFDLLGNVVGSDSLGQLKILRLIRLLRLIKLARVIRASRLFKRWEMSTDVSYSTLSMCKHFVVTTVATHWTTCLLHLVTSIEDVEENWVTFEMEFGVATDGDGNILVAASLRDEGTFGLYVAAFYAAVMALPMGVPNFVVPVTIWERVSSIFAMLFLGSIYAYVIGSICDVVANLDPATTEFQNDMDLLNFFMEEKAVPEDKRREIREYFHHCKALFRQKFYHDLLEAMSPTMRGDVARHMHGEWIAEIPFFVAPDVTERRAFTTAVALALEPMAFAPKELLIRIGEFTERMYIIQRGLVARMGRVLGAGRFVGEDVILHNSRRKYFVRVLTYLDVYALSKEALEQILEEGDFPSTYKTIRRAAIRLALTRELCRISDQVRLAKMLRSSNTGAEISVEQILSVSVQQQPDQLARGTEIVPDEEMPVARRRKASSMQVMSLEDRMKRLESLIDSTKSALHARMDKYRQVLVNSYHARQAASSARRG